MGGGAMGAVEKSLALLRTVDREGGSGLGVSELARRTGIAKSTVFRLVHTLERSQALERVGDRYRLGNWLGDALAIPTSPEVDRVQVAVTPFLAVLFERSRQTVHLAVADGPEILFLNKLHGLHRVASPSRIGGHAPAYCTSLGKVLAAFTPGMPELVAAQLMVPWTPSTNTDPDRWLAEMAGIRSARLAVDDQEYVAGVASVASVVTAADGRAVASLCVTGPRDEVVGAGYRGLVQDVCARATRAYRAQQPT